MNQAAEQSPARPGNDAATRLIMQFVGSIQEVLGTMAAMPVTVGTPFRRRGRSAASDVSGIIGFSGQFVGSMVLSFPLETARAIVSAFAGAPVDPDSPDFSDAIGELANMIAGDTKASLGNGTLISVPNIIFGGGHTVSGLQDVSCLVLPCQARAGAFTVAINIKPAGTRAVQGGPA